MRNFLLPALALLVGTSAASAGTIKILPDMNGAYKMAYLTSLQVSTDGGAKYRTVLAGQYQVKITGGSDKLVPPVPHDLLTYCLETAEVLNGGTGQVSLLSSGNDSQGGLGSDRASEIAQLLARFQPDLTMQQTKDMGAAIGLAIWEIADEPVGGALDLLSGTFRVKETAKNDSVIDLSQSFLDALTTNGPQLTDLHAIVIPRYQDLIIPGKGTHIVVAEPGVVGLFGLSAIGLIAARRRRARA